MDSIDWSKIHSENESWRSRLIGEISNAYVIPRYIELFFEYFGGDRARSFLELGSGNGDLSQRILEKDKGSIGRYVVTENFDEGVQWLQRKGLEAMRADALDIPAEDASFDAVLSFDIMHHVQDPRRMAHEMMRVARGRLLLMESNGLSLGRKLKELTPAYRAAGERSYTPWKYRSFFEHWKSEFEILSFEIHPFLFPFKAPAFLLPSLIAFNRWIEKLPLLRWQCSSVYIFVKYRKL